ncbi:putative Ulp1 protease family, C-terminal catalytic domain-containing protein [Homarus americanus]|uniref:Putative Ulp1 protease family, C-terminal catalytic domain-containing protein n=1 Tax=Homarus americanus TaxID=6706 RepID=A0A8J5N2W0_HOMAM|nr:putative Ulp1 protease family, C-terminal catalytic domain-containing protein [Homarus americanus]
MQSSKNVEAAQEKQKVQYRNRKIKAVKMYNINVGMLVLRRNLRNESRKGGKMEPKWSGPYKVLDIDSYQRVALELVKDSKKLKARVPYRHLRPLQSRFLNKASLMKSDTLISDHETPLQSRPVSPCDLLNDTPDVQLSTNPTPPSSPTWRPDEWNDMVVDRSTGQIEECVVARGKLQPDVHLAPVHKDPWVAASEVGCPGNWLSDAHVDHAQHLLGSSFPFISGFQSTVIFYCKNCVQVQAPVNHFVQILSVHKNHWLTLSNIGCNNNTVRVFDSLSSSGLQNSEEFNCQVAALLNCKSPKIRVEYANIKQQKGYSDCGLFAIACATSLCFGLPPETQNFAQEHMRSHLAKCFRDGIMKQFPVKSPTMTLKKNTYRYYEISIYCHCRKPKLVDSFLIQCMLCNNCYHIECENVMKDMKLFVCTTCKNFITEVLVSCNYCK